MTLLARIFFVFNIFEKLWMALDMILSNFLSLKAFLHGLYLYINQDISNATNNLCYGNGKVFTRKTKRKKQAGISSHFKKVRRCKKHEESNEEIGLIYILVLMFFSFGFAMFIFGYISYVIICNV